MSEIVSAESVTEWNAWSNDPLTHVFLFSWLLHALQTLLHILQVSLGYMLMLCVMSYNTWIFLGVIVGSALGYFISFPLLGRIWRREEFRQMMTFAFSPHFEFKGSQTLDSKWETTTHSCVGGAQKEEFFICWMSFITLTVAWNSIWMWKCSDFLSPVSVSLFSVFVCLFVLANFLN